MKSEEFLRLILSSIVTKPEEIRIESSQMEGGVNPLVAHVAVCDRPVAIGKRGETAAAIRKLVGIVSYQAGEKVLFTIAGGAE